jgi:hypothetical protein
LGNEKKCTEDKGKEQKLEKVALLLNEWLRQESGKSLQQH